MTVSLALREDQGTNRLSAETRERILRIARELSYSPNARGRVLRSGVTNVIGLYAGYGYVNVRMPFFTEVVSGLQEGCEEFGKDLLLHGTFRSRSITEIYNELRDGRIDGLIVVMPPHDPLAQMLVDSHLPVIAVADALPKIPSVTVDDAGGGRLIAQHLAERGYKKCLYVSNGPGPISASRRRQGFLTAAAEQQLEVEEFLPSESNPTNTVIEDWLGRDKAKRAEAIVGWNDTTAYDLLTQCRQHNVRVPEDVAIIGFDGCPSPYENYWSLTTIRAPWAKSAKTAVEQLNALLSGAEIPEETVLPVELFVGRTS